MRPSVWGAWLVPALLAFAPFFLRLWRFATCGASCGAGSVLGLFSDALTGSTFLALLLVCPRALRWLPALLWTLFQIGSLELYQAMQRYPVWQDLHYLLDANFVRNSTGSFKLAAPLFTAVLLFSALAASLVRLPRLRPRHLAWSVPALAVLFFAHARLEAGNAYAVAANRNPLHNFVLDTAHGNQSSENAAVALPESLKHADLSGESLLGGTAGKAKNVLIVAMEGIPGLYIPEIRQAMNVPEYEVTMDKLDKSTQNAMLVPDFVTHSHQTIRGLYSILCGDFSKFSFDMPKPFEVLGKPERAAACLPAQLAQYGYSTHYLQAAALYFMAKDRVMAAIGFKEAHGKEWFEEQKISSPFQLPSGWGPADSAFFQGAQRYIAELRKKEQPWMLTLLTVGTHHPFVVPKEIEARYSSPRDAAVALLDEAVADFLDKLKADGTLDDTLVIVTSDESHGSPRWDWASSWGLGVVIAPEQEKLPRIKQGGYGLVDMEVSILDYLHLPVPAQVLGRSFFRSYGTPREMLSATSGVLRRHTGDISIRCAGGRACTGFPAASILGQPPQEMEDLPAQQSAETYALASALNDALRAGSEVQSFSFASGEQRETPGGLLDWQHLTLPANSDVTVHVQMTLLEGSAGKVPFRIWVRQDHDSRLDELVDSAFPMPELPRLPELRPGESMDETFSFHNAILRRAVSFAMLAEGSKGLVRFDRFDVSIKKNPNTGAAPEHGHELKLEQEWTREWELSPMEEAVQAGNAEQVRALLEQGVDVNAANKKGSTALMWAVQYDRASIAEMLLDKGANPNAENNAGYIALGKAAAKGHAAIVNLLLEYGANINQADKDGRTALMEVAARGHVDIVRMLLKHGADANQSTKGGWTALMNAAVRGHTDIAQMLIDKGAGVNQATENGGTALMEAAAHGHVDIVRMLLKHGAGVNQATDGGWTALMNAAAQGYADIAQMLIDKGAGVNQATKNGGTALMEAAAHGHVDIVRKLLKHGADVNQATDGGWTALMNAAVQGYADIAQMLIDEGASVNQATKDGRTALMEAAARGHTDIVRLLVEKGANVNQANQKGETVLMNATAWGHVDTTRVLLRHGADVNQATDGGWTALMNAAAQGYADIAQMLIDKGAGVNQATENGGTALMEAAVRGHTDTVRILLKYGADVNQATEEGWTALKGAEQGKHAEIVEMLRAAGAGEVAAPSQQDAGQGGK